MFSRHDYAFDLPPQLIAQHPAERRDGSRLLHLAPAGLADEDFARIAELLPRDSVVVANDTRVMPARVFAQRPTGGAVELLFLEEVSAETGGGGRSVWRCLARARRPLRVGNQLQVGPVRLELVAGRGEDTTVEVAVPGDALDFLHTHGVLPLPHYIERAAGDADQERYQTVFARAPGAVAAPTAGLHFTPELIAGLAGRGIDLTTVTLHVGIGTFTPVRVEDVREHRMHRERYQISEAAAALITSGRPVVAVGTTVVRALESASTGPRQLRAGPGATQIFFHPGCERPFLIVDHLITNFHLPESTLLMLVCAFAGRERVLAAYRHAVNARYRFFSYGDAMLVSRADP